MRVVLDTNLWLSGLVYGSASSPPRRIIERLEQGDFVVVTSPELADEFDEVMRRHGLAQATLQKWLGILKRTHLKRPPYVRHVEPTQRIEAIYQDIPILSPRDFIARLNQEK